MVNESTANFEITKDNDKLKFSKTPRIEKFLNKILQSDTISDDEKQLVRKHLSFESGDTIPYSLLKTFCLKLRLENENAKEGPWLHEILIDSEVAFEKPKPREKSKQLQKRLKKLQEDLDDKMYDNLVKDVTASEKKEGNREFMNSYKDQFGFGLHVIAIMFTGYVFGYTVFKSQFRNNPVMNAIGGVIGLIIGMLVEVFLFMIRMERYYENQEGSNNKSGKKVKSKLEYYDSTDIRMNSNPESTSKSNLRRRKT